MRKKVWMFIVLGMLLPALMFTASCNKEVIQTQPVSISEPEPQKAPDKPVMKAEEDEQIIEQLQTEAASREDEEQAFVPENINFAFNSAALSPQAQLTLSDIADHLRTNPDITITVEGHCDERGSNAYNMALGERRAESAKTFLVDNGIGANRLETVSYGEEQPIAMGASEASWAKNRRAEFVIN